MKRREFLQGVGAVVSTAALPVVVPSLEPDVDPGDAWDLGPLPAMTTAEYFALPWVKTAKCRTLPGAAFVTGQKYRTYPHVTEVISGWHYAPAGGLRFNIFVFIHEGIIPPPKDPLHGPYHWLEFNDGSGTCLTHSFYSKELLDDLWATHALREEDVYPYRFRIERVRLVDTP